MKTIYANMNLLSSVNFIKLQIFMRNLLYKQMFNVLRRPTKLKFIFHLEEKPLD